MKISKSNLHFLKVKKEETQNNNCVLHFVYLRKFSLYKFPFYHLVVLIVTNNIYVSSPKVNVRSILYSGNIFGPISVILTS